ncbi:hypothetical protein Godav_019553 [Gossypium davidsonii]|uniref:Uncharacterized protein n=1 Tax=Gossypium davidsonii TaxID=34287 RepID=A0A7J8R0W6_GOSDV|nr:hypothetical protein [Gossypium davidsonii]
MQNTRGKSKVPAHSKKRKTIGTLSSSSPTVTTCHQYLTFDHPLHEQRYQNLKDRALSVSRCIDWEALQTGLFTLIHSLLAATPWEWVFVIVELTYTELTLEFCSTFFLQTVLSSGDDARAISFRLGHITRQFSIAGFGVTLGLYSNDFLVATEHEDDEHLDDDTPLLPRPIPTPPSPSTDTRAHSVTLDDISQRLDRLECLHYEHVEK